MNGATPHLLTAGETVDSLTVISLIGNGGFGEVYLVRDVSGGRFALKALRRRAETEIAGFVRVREKLGRIDGLAAIHSAGKLPDGRLYYLMECADDLGGDGAYIPDTLANRLARNGAMDAAQLLGIVADILAVCEKLHAAGFVHRDIKPENIIFAGGRTKLADFGLTAPIGDAEADAGTLAFMPKEEVYGKVKGGYHEGMDLYAIGKLLYCTYNLRAAEEYPMPGEIIDGKTFRIVRKIYAKALDEKPFCRFRSAASFRKSVLHAKMQLEAPPSSAKRSIFFAAALVALTALSLYAGWQYFRKNPPVKITVPEKSSAEPDDRPWEEPLFEDSEDRRWFDLVTQTSRYGMTEYGKLCGSIYRLETELHAPRRDSRKIREELAAARKEMDVFLQTAPGRIIGAQSELAGAEGDPQKYRAVRDALRRDVRAFRKKMTAKEKETK
ncbi:MAG: protein kinase [Victivallaceae bacterium]|nr:protein kinase [Victivallaceae bacterium]